MKTEMEAKTSTARGTVDSDNIEAEVAGKLMAKLMGIFWKLNNKVTGFIKQHGLIIFELLLSVKMRDLWFGNQNSVGLDNVGPFNFFYYY